jgi:hypothetical protein
LGRQQERLLELRAAVSLARLWGEQGRRAEDSDLLAPVCGWFTEGFDTADLKEAKALLDDLTRAGRQHFQQFGANDRFLVNSTIRWRGQEWLFRVESRCSVTPLTARPRGSTGRPPEDRVRGRAAGGA